MLKVPDDSTLTSIVSNIQQTKAKVTTADKSLLNPLFFMTPHPL
jgi:hypothetical protein